LLWWSETFSCSGHKKARVAGLWRRGRFGFWTCCISGRLEADGISESRYDSPTKRDALMPQPSSGLGIKTTCMGPLLHDPASTTLYPVTCSGLKIQVFITHKNLRKSFANYHEQQKVYKAHDHSYIFAKSVYKKSIIQKLWICNEIYIEPANFYFIEIVFAYDFGCPAHFGFIYLVLS
jgi:hypothetical protein